MKESTLKELRELAQEGNREIFSAKMCELLTDDSVKTLGMFESLAYDYTNESNSEEFRKGMDSALEILLYYNMEEIFEEMKELNEKAKKSA